MSSTISETMTSPEAATPIADVTPQTSRRLGIRLAILAVILALAAWFVVPWVVLSLKTISTDDAYVDGHVTFAAPRVSGRILEVLVDDNVRVKKGDVLVRIDPEPFQVQVEIRQALVEVAQTNLAAAHAEVEALVASVRSERFNLEHAIENVGNQISVLKANVAQLAVEQAGFVLAERDYERNKPLVAERTITQQDLDLYLARRDQARSRVQSAIQVVQETRTLLGLPIDVENPLKVPADIEQNYSLVRQALAQLLKGASQLGYKPRSWSLTPKQAIEEFYKLDAEGNLDHIYAKLITNAPAIKQAEANLLQAQRNLEAAQLDVRYCTVTSDIDGVVTRRNVNPGNFVQVGQSLMAVRSLTEIWVNANFKETQLAEMRIGQRVKLEVDMYGKREEFEGRITGFTMGTGQTLALLPPQNATGNFIKIVQRLPVRIELTNYDPEKSPLFVGLSVTPYVYFKEPAEGPNAGKFLQSFANLPSLQSKTLQSANPDSVPTAPVQK